MTAPSSELSRPFFVLRKAQLRLLACGFLRRHPCRLFQNEGYLSFRGEPRFQLSYQPPCRICGCWISYVNRFSFGLPCHPPRSMFAASDPLPATRSYDAATMLSVAGAIFSAVKDHPRVIRGRISSSYTQSRAFDVPPLPHHHSWLQQF